MAEANNNWRVNALCADHENPDLWFPTFETSQEEIQEAKDLCHECPVREECRVQGKGQWGIWGGVLKRLDPGDE